MNKEVSDIAVDMIRWNHLAQIQFLNPKSKFQKNRFRRQSQVQMAKIINLARSKKYEFTGMFFKYYIRLHLL